MSKKVEYGFIFKAVTGLDYIPDNPKEIWEAVSKATGVKEPACRFYGNPAIDSAAGGLFPVKEYDTDVDSLLYGGRKKKGR